MENLDADSKASQAIHDSNDDGHLVIQPSTHHPPSVWAAAPDAQPHSRELLYYNDRPRTNQSQLKRRLQAEQWKSGFKT
jgi:hypothetical protein